MIIPYIFKVFIEYPINLGSGCISMFSVNLIFDKTLTMQFCYLFLQKSLLFGLQTCKYSKLNLNTFALSCCIAATTCCVGVAMQLLSAKVFELSFEYLHIYSKIASLTSCQRSDLRKTLKYRERLDSLFNFWIPYCKSQTPPLHSLSIIYFLPLPYHTKTLCLPVPISSNLKFQNLEK